MMIDDLTKYLDEIDRLRDVLKTIAYGRFRTATDFRAMAQSALIRKVVSEKGKVPSGGTPLSSQHRQEGQP